MGEGIARLPCRCCSACLAHARLRLAAPRVRPGSWICAARAGRSQTSPALRRRVRPLLSLPPRALLPPALPGAPGHGLPGAASACLPSALLSLSRPLPAVPWAVLRATRNSASGPAPQCAARPEPSPPALVRHALGEIISTLPICKAHPGPPATGFCSALRLPRSLLALSACRCVLESLPQSSTRRVGTFVGKLCTDLRHLPI